MFVDMSSKGMHPLDRPHLKWLLIILLVIVVAAVMVAAVSMKKTNTIVQLSVPTPKQETATLAPAEEATLEKQSAALIKAGDMDACKQIGNDKYRGACVSNIASDKANETGDISYCQYLDDQLITRDSCERQILVRKSIEKEDVNVCGETKSESVKNDCKETYFFTFATQKNDPAFCDKNDNKAGADHCWNQFQVSKNLPAAMGGKKGFDCTTLRGADVQADCAALSPILKENDQTKLQQVCQHQKTTVFGVWCMMMNRGMPTTAPQQ